MLVDKSEDEVMDRSTRSEPASSAALVKASR